MRYIVALMVLFVSSLQCAQPEVTVTVWVHGTYPALKVLAHKYSPFKSWVHAKPGLSLAKELPYHYHFRQLAHQLNAYNNKAYNLDHFYTYGWHSSTLRPAKRRHEGKKLYEELDALLKTYTAKYHKVNVRLIGVSHGGNVVLHCLRHLPFTTDVSVDVVLLGTPVQESNRMYVNNKHVHRVYSFYSQSDWMQRMDIQKVHNDAPCKAPFWSNRTFKETDEVVQVLLKVNGKFISHGRYRSISKHLPHILNRVDSCIEDKAKKAHIVLDFSV